MVCRLVLVELLLKAHIDYAGLAAATDFLIMMDYDMRSQIFGPCIASANSPPNLILDAIQNFTKLGISPDKLVMGYAT